MSRFLIPQIFMINPLMVLYRYYCSLFLIAPLSLRLCVWNTYPTRAGEAVAVGAWVVGDPYGARERLRGRPAGGHQLGRQDQGLVRLQARRRGHGLYYEDYCFQG